MARPADYKPRLRPVEAFPVEYEEAAHIGVRDRSGLIPSILVMTQPAIFLLSQMDGLNTTEDIRCRFLERFGVIVPAQTVEELLDHLEQAYLLEGPVFEAHYQRLLDAYRALPARGMNNAQALGIEGLDGAKFDEMLSESPAHQLDGHVAGLVAPHLDYPRGRSCYGRAYGALRGRKTPDRVVILGTNHFGRAKSIVATGKAFETPLGTTPCDMEFLEKLEQTHGNLREFELDHQREHSIELQVAWLQHLFGARSFSLVALLCPDPCGPTDRERSEDHRADLVRFSQTLACLMDDDGLDTLLIAGADMSHVGLSFGDTRPLSQEFLEEVGTVDLHALQAIETSDPALFVKRLAGTGNATRVCSAGCIFTLASVLPSCKARMIHYHQAVDQATQTCVTCAALVFTQPTA